jgi:flagellar biogenesis protein FliO
LAKAAVTLAGMKRRLLFAILLIIVLALIVKYGAAAPIAYD